jgi:hypothetical protein
MTTRISQLASLGSPQTNVLLPVVDVNDHSQSSAGTTKQSTLLALLSALALSGDLSGTLAAPVVAKLHGLAVGTSPGGTSSFLRADGSWSVPPTAAGLTDWINVVTAYSADSTGVSDSTGAFQSAINAAITYGTVVYVPAGTFLCGVLSVTKPFTMMGAGAGATTLKLKNATNDYLIKFTQTSGAITNARFCDFKIDCNAGGQSASSGGIKASGSVECYFERLHFTSAYDWGLILGPQPGGAFGHNNRIAGCTFDNATSSGVGGGLWTTSNDENMITGCDFQYLGGGAAPAGSAYPVALYDQAGLHMITGCTFVGSRGSATNVLGIRVQNATQTRVVGCTFDGVGGDGVWIAGTDCVVTGCEFTSVGDQAATAGIFAGVHLEFGTARCIVTNNNLSSSSTNGKTGYLIREESTGGSGSNLIANNALRVNGTIAVAKLATAGTASIVTGNIGYNPVGALGPPAVPTSTTVFTNPYNVECRVYVSGGTVTVIALDGQATGLTTGGFVVAAGGTITLTYSVAPTWVWIGK